MAKGSAEKDSFLERKRLEVFALVSDSVDLFVTYVLCKLDAEERDKSLRFLSFMCIISVNLTFIERVLIIGMENAMSGIKTELV